MRLCTAVVAAASLLTCESHGAELLLEAESFADRGGWAVDQQFVDVMGSPYLLAHGMGSPVPNASTTAAFPRAGTYRVWVRTKDWVPGFAGPGTFGVHVDGVPLSVTFGDGDYGWSWQDGGTVDVAGTTATVQLVDATGFEGRCDAVYFTTDLAATPPNDLAAMKPWRRALAGLPVTPPVEGEFDLVVVGGGIAGCCASVAAARLGLTVALVHDRPFLGGNASQEVRVHTLGETGRIVSEIDTAHYANGSAESIAYDARRHGVVDAEPNIDTFMNWRAFDVEMDGQLVVAVYARHTETGEERQFRAPLFVDSTGDGWIGYWAGAEYRTGREAQAEYNESLAPATADDMKMGSSLLWNSADAGSAQTFPAVAWAMDVALDYSATSGEWFWEYGIDPALDTIYDAEDIRDHLFRAIYGSFANAKALPANANLRLEWVGYVAGKRESRRLVGDYVLTENDVRDPPVFPDGVVHESREIDIHFRKPGPYDFLSEAQYTSIGRFWIPFRCLYSVNVENLMMAGRCFSASHVGLGSPRVMNTCGQMGVAVGSAAYVCKAYRTTPRGVYADHLDDLLAVVREGAAGTERREQIAIVDNSDTTGVEVVGAWPSSTFEAGFYGPDYIHDDNALKGAKTVRFTPTIPEAGTYQVYFRWTSSDSRADNVPVDVTHATGTETVTVNEKQDGSQWVLIGAWDFDAGAGGNVLVRTGGTNGHVVADAVMIARAKVHELVASPGSCSFNGSMDVEMSCFTLGAEIRYTTDGALPTSASTLYAGALSLSATTTVKAAAFKDGLEPSAVVSATYTRTDAATSGGSSGGCGACARSGGLPLSSSGRGGAAPPSWACWSA